MLEKKIEFDHFRKRFHNEDLGICLKLRPIGFLSRGFPDRTVLWRGGHTHFIEFKRPGEKPTKIQKECHKLLRSLGFKVFVIDTIEGADAYLSEYKLKFKLLL